LLPQNGQSTVMAGYAVSAAITYLFIFKRA
jgi:hypothetical protein